MLIKKANFQLFSKSLFFGKNSICAVNSFGRKTFYHRGSGVKKSLRIIDFNKYLCSIPALVLSVEYDPNRTALVSLYSYSNGSISYSLSVVDANPGSIVSTVVKKIYEVNNSDTAFLNFFKPGVYINCLEVRTGHGARYVRAGGSFAKLVSVTKDNFAIVKLKSKNLIKINANNIATMGILPTPFRTHLGKAGVNRRLGRRSHVRGVAMNPVDHPHGGGQGKTSGGRPSVTP